MAIDTLAYKWSRPAPRLLKPRGNVIIRLCPIECNYAVPMTDPSNAEFQSDLSDWSAASNRTFIWNYQTNFGASKAFPHRLANTALTRFRRARQTIL